MKKIRVKLKPSSYDVLIGHGGLNEAGKRIKVVLPSRTSMCVVVTSPTVRRHWGKKLEESLRRASINYKVVEVDDSESAKTLGTLERLLALIIKAGADRGSVVVAFGGGVIGDMAGLAASTFMRGIPVVQIPTTLLAQVDASVGGKTGVNLASGKNLVGTFHQPCLVLIDPQVLGTLQEREFRAGMFEVIKAGAIGSRKLFDLAVGQKARILRFDKKTLESLITECVKFKAAVVASDERENGLRRILNFGHTIGHALEAATRYERYLHGEAVGLGMIAAASIGMVEKVTPVPVAQKILSAVMEYGPLPAINMRDSAILPFLKADKKAERGAPRFVLLKGIGKPMIAKNVSARSILYGLQVLRSVGESQGNGRG